MALAAEVACLVVISAMAMFFCLVAALAGTVAQWHSGTVAVRIGQESGGRGQRYVAANGGDGMLPETAISASAGL